jgi:hypothetical protein
MSQLMCSCGRGPVCGHGEPCEKCMTESLTNHQAESDEQKQKRINFRDENLRRAGLDPSYADINFRKQTVDNTIKNACQTILDFIKNSECGDSYIVYNDVRITADIGYVNDFCSDIIKHSK